MLKGLVLSVALTMITLGSCAQEVAGIRIGEPASVLENLNITPTAREAMGSKQSVKYRLGNGNELAVTYDGVSRRIVYLECDWSRDQSAAKSDFPSFRFGSTTLAEIRRASGSNGFSYKSHRMFTTENELVTFNAYLVEGKPGLVAIFVTAVNIAELRKRRENKAPGAENIAENLRLDAVILADETYLDQIWGNEKLSDPQAKPISWPAKTEKPS